VARLRKKELCMALVFWREVNTLRSKQARCLKRGLSGLKTRHTRMAWNKWLDTTRNDLRQERRVKHALLSWQKRHLMVAWNTWFDYYLTIQGQKRALLMCVKHMQAKTVAAWNTWAQYTVECRNSERLLRGALMKLRQRSLSKAFNQWGEWYLYKTDTEAKAGRFKEYHSKFTAFLLRRSMKKWRVLLRSREYFDNRSEKKAWAAVIADADGKLGEWNENQFRWEVEREESKLKTNEITLLRQQLAEALSTVERVEDEKTTLKDELINDKSRVSVLDNELSMSREEKVMSDTKVEVLQSQLSALKESLQTLKEETLESRTSIANLEMTVAERNKDIQRLKSLMHESEVAIIRELKASQDECQRLAETNAEEMRQMESMYNAAFDAAQEDAESEKIQIELKHREELDALSSLQQEELSSLHEVLTTELETLREQVSSSKEQDMALIAELKKAHEEAIAEMRSAQDEVKQQKKLLDKLHLTGKARGMKMLLNIMAAWMFGSMRGCFFVYKSNFIEETRLLGDQKKAMKMLTRIMSEWMAGTVRGFYFSMKVKWQQDCEEKDAYMRGRLPYDLNLTL